MMLSAKLEQFEIPSFEVMDYFLVESHGIRVSLTEFVKLEITILKAL